MTWTFELVTKRCDISGAEILVLHFSRQGIWIVATAVLWVVSGDSTWGQSYLGIVSSLTGGAIAQQPPESELILPVTSIEPIAADHRRFSRRHVDRSCHWNQHPSLEDAWPEDQSPVWQWFPNGLIYRSYLGSQRESRFASVLSKDEHLGWLWDVSLGGRVGLFRYGNGPDFWPDGWQLDMEGAAFPRLDPWGRSTPLLSTDFRFGFPITYGQGPWRFKTGYYHISSHLGDEYMINTPDYTRYNYSRDAFILALSYYFGRTPATRYDWRCYAEVTWADWAKSRGGVAEPWEFLFGIEYSPALEFRRGAPFAAIHAHLREEARFGGHFAVQAGWQLERGPSGALFRFGGEYINGKSTQGSFFKEYENRIGVGLWYDF